MYVDVMDEFNWSYWLLLFVAHKGEHCKNRRLPLIIFALKVKYCHHSTYRTK